MNGRFDPKGTQRRYDRLASWYDLLEAPMERLGFASWRARLLERIGGDRVLEVGVGTGKNIPYYPQGIKITASDLSPRMLERARKRASHLHKEIDFLEMDVQKLGFPEHHFDTIFATFVFCSVPDPVVGLRELRRVCRPGGRVFLLEHMQPRNPILGFFFDLLNPVAVRVTGANINRKTEENVRAAGWQIRLVEHLFLDVVRWIEAEG